MSKLYNSVSMTAIVFLILFQGCANIDSDYNKAVQQNTFSSYDRFLIKHGNNKYKDDVKDRKETLLWENALTYNRIDNYTSYISIYPKGKYANIAKENLCHLLWEKAEQEKYYATYKKYLRCCSDSGEHVEEAKNKYEKYFWEKTEGSPSIESYEGYISKFPSGLYVSEANNKLKKLELEKKRIKEQEEKNRKIKMQ